MKAIREEADLDWELRLAAAWQQLGLEAAPAFMARIEALAGELAATDPRGLFERAAAHDSTGAPARAVPLYRAALAGGLAGPHRRRATVQLASSLRNLGDAAAAIDLLQRERQAGSDELDDAVEAFLALALCSAGREREAVGIALAALAPHLPRYRQSLARYAAELAP